MDTEGNPKIDLHLNSKCSKHNLKISSISKLPDSNIRFLCKLCKDKVNGEKIFNLSDLLDEDILALLQEKVDAQISAPQGVDDRYSAVFESIEKTFASLRADIDARLKKSEEAVKNKFRDFMANKAMSGPNWVDLDTDFKEKRLKYIESKPVEASNELKDYLSIYDKVLGSFENNGAQDAEPQKEFEINNKVVEKFQAEINKMCEQVEQRFIEFSFGSVKVNRDNIQEFSQLQGKAKGVFKAVVSIDDQELFVTGGTDGELTVWDSAKLTVITSAKVHKSLISSLIYIPSKKQLLSASLDKTIKVYNVANHTVDLNNCVTLSGAGGFIFGICYLEDIDRVVSAGYEKELKFWNIEAQKVDFAISTNGWSSDSYEIAHIKEEKLIAVVGKDIIRLYDYASKSLFHEIKTEGLSMQSIQYLKKSNSIAASIKPGVIRLWNLDNRKVTQGNDIKFEAVGESPYTLYAIEDQDLILFTSRSKFFSILSINDGSLVKKTTTLKDAIGITVLKNSGKIVVADNQSNNLTVFSI